MLYVGDRTMFSTNIIRTTMTVCISGCHNKILKDFKEYATLSDRRSPYNTTDRHW